jgi:hypothetical protein
MDSAYSSFTGDGNTDFHDLEIRIDLRIGKKPDTGIWEKIFDSESSWSMFRKDDRYCIALKPEGFDQAIWQAVVKPGFTDATVYCDEGLLNFDEGLHNPVCYPLDQILLMYILGPRQGLLLHAAGAVFGQGRGFLFPGKSGAGKSTLASQIIANSEKSLLSDDRIIIRKHDMSFAAYGTPWPGEAGIAENRGTDVSALFFLKQENFCSIRQLHPKEAYKALLPMVSIPWYDREMMSNIMGFCEDIINTIPCYEFSFTPGKEAVTTLMDFNEASEAIAGDS